MLRRKPTAITLTSEDVAAYEDRQAANMDAAAAAAASLAQGLDSSQALSEIDAARLQQGSQTAGRYHAGADSNGGGNALGGPTILGPQSRNPQNGLEAEQTGARTTRNTQNERIGIAPPAAGTHR